MSILYWIWIPEKLVLTGASGIFCGLKGKTGIIRGSYFICNIPQSGKKKQHETCDNIYSIQRKTDTMDMLHWLTETLVRQRNKGYTLLRNGIKYTVSAGKVKIWVVLEIFCGLFWGAASVGWAGVSQDVYGALQSSEFLWGCSVLSLPPWAFSHLAERFTMEVGRAHCCWILYGWLYLGYRLHWSTCCSGSCFVSLLLEYLLDYSILNWPDWLSCLLEVPCSRRRLEV